MDASTAGTYDVVIVHYDNPEVYGVVEAVLRQSVAPRRIVLVDNSGTVDPARIRAIAPDAQLLTSANDGYAAAANAGIRALGAGSAPFVVVLTHEVRLEDGTLPALVHALDTNARLGAAGPQLRFRSAPERVFSRGGRLDRFGRPSHDTSRTTEPAPAISHVTWIDGSVMALRRSALDQVGRFDPQYFLYFEEIDLAVRLDAAGWGTAVVRDAVAWQEPGGYPPYLAVRNRLLMLRRNPGLLRAPKALLYPRVLAEILWTARRRGPRTVIPSLRGLFDGVRGRNGVPAL